MRRMMVLETVLDIKLALLNSNTDRADLPLNRAEIPLKRAQCSHNLGKSNVIMEQSEKRKLRSVARTELVEAEELHLDLHAAAGYSTS